MASRKEGQAAFPCMQLIGVMSNWWGNRCWPDYYGGGRGRPPLSRVWVIVRPQGLG